MNRPLSRFQVAFLSWLSLQRVFIVGLSEKGPQKRDHAWFLCTEEYFNVKRFLQKMCIFLKFFLMEIRAHQPALQDACHDSLSRHPARAVACLPEDVEEAAPKAARQGRFTARRPQFHRMSRRGWRLAFLCLIGYSSA